MAQSFSRQFTYNKKSQLAVVIPQLKKDGMHFEVNIKGYARFYMAWSALGRFDITDTGMKIPYDLVLAVSDLIEQYEGKK
ncbi:MAG: hypothetical protein H7257_12650 [Taibaiella sp.]|nr:hypothetical protein [Taibaiella sp.]